MKNNGVKVIAIDMYPFTLCKDPGPQSNTRYIFIKAKEHHPDSRTAGVEGGEAVKFIELTEAYKRLTYESRNTAHGLHNVDRTGEFCVDL